MISFLKSKAEPRGFSATFFSSRMKPSGFSAPFFRGRAKPSGFSTLTTVEGQNLPEFGLATAIFGVNARGRGFSADVGRPIPEGRLRVPAK